MKQSKYQIETLSRDGPISFRYVFKQGFVCVG